MEYDATTKTCSRVTRIIAIVAGALRNNNNVVGGKGDDGVGQEKAGFLWVEFRRISVQ